MANSFSAKGVTCACFLFSVLGFYLNHVQVITEWDVKIILLVSVEAFLGTYTPRKPFQSSYSL